MPPASTSPSTISIRLACAAVLTAIINTSVVTRPSLSPNTISRSQSPPCRCCSSCGISRPASASSRNVVRGGTMDGGMLLPPLFQIEKGPGMTVSGGGNKGSTRQRLAIGRAIRGGAPRSPPPPEAPLSVAPALVAATGTLGSGEGHLGIPSIGRGDLEELV